MLVLQGGGALGAFQVGAYRALHESGFEPDWVIGTSIGAINGAIIAGNRPDDRLGCLTAFWSTVARRGLAPWLPVRLNNALSDLAVFSGGVPGFFRPAPAAWLGPETAVGIERAAYYDTAPLRRTLAELVDLEWLNRHPTRLTVGAVNVRSGEMRYFDSRGGELGLDHILASGALPPAFPAVRIEGEPYWDGGIYSNTPIEAVLDDHPRRDSLIFSINLWPAEGTEPLSITEVLTRHKEIQYASRARSHIARQRQIHRLRHVIGELGRRLPEAERNREEIRALCAWGCTTTMHVVMLSPPRLEGETASKDIDFSASGLEAREAAGFARTRAVLERAPWTAPIDPIEGVVVHAG